MTTPVRGRSLRQRLLRFITDATARITAAWNILTTAQTRLLNALAAIRPGRGAPARIRAAAVIFQRSLAAFDRAAAGFAERWAATDLPLIYREGALTTLDHADRPHSRWSWTARHQEAVTSLTAQYYVDLMGRLREAVRRAQAFLRAAVDAARQAGRSAAPFDPQRLRDDHPLDTVIYSNSTRHPVADWADAALSGQTVATANAGAIRTALDELGCEWLEVRDGHGCGWETHGDPDTAHGTVRTIQDALAHPLAHPRCRREFVPRMDLTGRLDLDSGAAA